MTVVEVPIMKRGAGRRAVGRREVVVAYARVDYDDVADVMCHAWRLHPQGYACSSTAGMMHRFVLGLEPGDGGVDHINRDKLDNRRENLRIISQAANSQNRSGWTRATSSSHRGVYWNAAKGLWIAEGTLNRRKHYIGGFKREVDAAAAAMDWRAENMPYSSEAEL